METKKDLKKNKRNVSYLALFGIVMAFILLIF